MEQVHMIGIDLAKHGFQLFGARAYGSAGFRKKLSIAKAPGILASLPHCAELSDENAYILMGIHSHLIDDGHAPDFEAARFDNGPYPQFHLYFDKAMGRHL